MQEGQTHWPTPCRAAPLNQAGGALARQVKLQGVAASPPSRGQWGGPLPGRAVGGSRVTGGGVTRGGLWVPRALSLPWRQRKGREARGLGSFRVSLCFPRPSAWGSCPSLGVCSCSSRVVCRLPRSHRPRPPRERARGREGAGPGFQPPGLSLTSQRHSREGTGSLVVLAIPRRRGGQPAGLPKAREGPSWSSQGCGAAGITARGKHRALGSTHNL